MVMQFCGAKLVKIFDIYKFFIRKMQSPHKIAGNRRSAVTPRTLHGIQWWRI